MFFKRSYKKEIMDDFFIDNESVIRALKELRIINKYLGGNRATKKGLTKILLKIPEKNYIKILDAGGGSSDNLLALENNTIKIFSLDINKNICRYVKENSPEVGIVCSDIFSLPFKEKQFDIVHLSLFLHHFNEEEIHKILTELISKSVYGIIINDLQRSFFAFLGIKILTTLFSKSNMVKNDGPLSVKKGFIKRELIALLEKLNINYKIFYKWAFRWVVVIYL